MNKTTLEAMLANKPEHAVVNENGFICNHCGGAFTLNYPISADKFISKGELFIKLHRDCKPINKI